jgi:hypothetical protein
MTKIRYKVIATFDPKKNYGIHLGASAIRCLSSFKVNQTFVPKEFISQNRITKRPSSKPRSNQIAFYKIIRIAKKIGLIEQVCEPGMSFEQFCNLDTIKLYKSQLSVSRFKNLKNNTDMSNTQKTYLHTLHRFNQWLTDREYSLSIMVPSGQETFRRVKKIIKLEHLEHLLNLYAESHNSKSEFIKIIKEYLFDPMHENKKSSVMKNTAFIIKGYFSTNDYEINFKFAANNKYDSEVVEKSLTLEDFFKLMTDGKPNVMQKAVLMIKFHHGCDNSTFCDRFNYDAWRQLVQWFETDDYTKWDLSKVPVPINLVRVKTRYRYTGFIDRDGIEALKKYLNVRQRNYGKVIDGEPIFINRAGRPINALWIRDSFFRIGNVAGVIKPLGGKTRNAYNMDSHELRDLLKSTLIDCNCRPDVADHVIGHTPKDSYSKQHLLYPKTLRLEYMKASHRLNIFSRALHSLKSDTELDRALEKRLDIQNGVIEKMRSELEMTKRVLSFTNDVTKYVVMGPTMNEKCAQLIEKNINAKTPEEISFIHKEMDQLFKDKILDAKRNYSKSLK